MQWKLLHPKATPDHLGALPSFLDEHDQRPAREQIDDNYRHGGGWRPMPEFKMNRLTLDIKYPGDPPLQPVATTKIRTETIVFYASSFVAIIQENGDFEVARVD